MRKTALCLLLALAAAPALAQKKDCSELKAAIDAKILRSGVTVFTTTIAQSGTQTDGKVVGTCDGGAMKIIYKRGF